MAKITRLHNYQEALAVWLRGNGDVKIGRETWLHAEQDIWNEPDSVDVLLYDHPILTYHRDGRIRLSSCGFRTRVTLDRLNQLLPEGWGVHTRRGEWWVLGPTARDEIPFTDDMVILGKEKPMLENVITPAYLRWFATKYVAKLWLHQLARMRESEYRPLSGDEIRTLVENRQFHPWILWQATKERRNDFPGVANSVCRILLTHQSITSNYHNQDPLIIAGLTEFLSDLFEMESA